jgi:hypothetical protein
MGCVDDEKKGLAASLQQAPLFSSVKPVQKLGFTDGLKNYF